MGTSGGVWGLERGYCMMVGGSKEAVDTIDPILDCLAPGIGDIPRTPGREKLTDTRAERGYIHAGPTGAGHFVKMVHNGIEYGLMQAYAEGFDILQKKNSPDLTESERFDLNLTDIAEVWRRGSVISSWLLDLTASALTASPKLDHFSGVVDDSGEGRWTIEAAIEEAVPANVLSAALYARFRSREEHTFGEKALSAMRFGFGGHVEHRDAPGARGRRQRTHAALRRAPWVSRPSQLRPPRSPSTPKAGPCAMVIFGGGGDLTKRLVTPALYNLATTGLLPDDFAIVGVDHSDGTDEGWRGSLDEMMQSFVGGTGEFDPSKIDAGAWDWLKSRMFYLKGDFEDPKTFEAVKSKLAEVEASHGRAATSCSTSPWRTGFSAPWSTASAPRS